MLGRLRHNSIKRLCIIFSWILALSLAITALSITFLMHSENPKVFFLYTQKEGIPDFVFKLSSVPLALSSFIKYKRNVLKLAPVNTGEVREAFDRGEFLIVGTHGLDGAFIADDKVWIYPDSPDAQAKPQMKLVYFGACYAATKQKGWERKFPNAVIKGHDGLTTPRVGWLYLFFQSPLDIFRI
jgi:hypothetical protein